MSLVKSVYRSRINKERRARACENLNELNASEINLEDNEEVILNCHFSSLIQYIASMLLRNKVRLNNQVEKIDYTRENEILVKVNDSMEKKSFVYSCDYVIVTMPLGYLKKNHVEIFAPELAGEKASAIEKLGFGCVNKIFIVFERPFLNEKQMREGINYLEVLWRDDLPFELNSNTKWNLEVGFYLNFCITLIRKPKNYSETTLHTHSTYIVNGLTRSILA